jgi:hypothetical protein
VVLSFVAALNAALVPQLQLAGLGMQSLEAALRRKSVPKRKNRNWHLS